VFNDTYEWSNLWGEVSIEVTVTEQQVNGDDVYLWEYAVTNDEFPDIGYFALPVFEPDPYYPIGLDGIRLTVGALDTTQTGWMGGIDYATDRPPYTEDAYIWWEIGNDEIDLGHSGVFSFRTAPTTISSGQGIVKDTTGIAPTIIGAIAAPVALDPREVTTKGDTVSDPILGDGLVSLRESVGWVISKQPTDGIGPTVWFGIVGPVTLDPTKGRIELGAGNEEKEITIDGPRTIQRSGESKGIFLVPAGARVELKYLTLSNGKTI
jgi:hypothetical protein